MLKYTGNVTFQDVHARKNLNLKLSIIIIIINQEIYVIKVNKFL